MLVTTLLFVAVSKPGWQLAFSDEFNGKSGVAPNPRIWKRDLGGSGFGNNELQSYTAGNANAFLDGKGHLIIEARKEPTKGADGIARDYSSARLTTFGTVMPKYGKVEARMMMPTGNGIWPAFWMMGENIKKVGWPSGGEIDIMEHIGRRPKTIFGTLHGPGYAGGSAIGKTIDLKQAPSKGFHVYGVEWDPSQISWFVDGRRYHQVVRNEMNGRRWVYDQPFFIILNLAVGGNMPGNPDETSTYPQRFIVDYVRVYRDGSLKVDEAAIRAMEEARLKKAAEFQGHPGWDVPGSKAAMDFDADGAYDTDKDNQGGRYRFGQPVDIGGSGVESPPYAVGWNAPGEYLTYTMRVRESRTYRLSIKVASEGLGGVMGFELDGKPVGHEIKVPDTGSWTKWQNVDGGEVELKQGSHKLRILMKSVGPNGSVGNLLELALR